MGISERRWPPRRRPALLALLLCVLALPVVALAGDGEARPGSLTLVRSDANCLSRYGGDRCAEGRALRGLEQIAISRDGRSLYAASEQGIAILERDPRTGAVAQPRGEAGCLATRAAQGCTVIDGLPGQGVPGLLLSPDDRTLYASGAGETFLQLDRASDGSLSQPEGPARCLGPDPDAEVFDGERPDDDAIPDTGCEVIEDAPALGALRFSPVGGSAYMTYGSQPTRIASLATTEEGGLRLRRTEESCVREEDRYGSYGPCQEVPGFDGGPTALSPDGLSLYAASEGVVLGFATDPVSGTIDPLLGDGGCASQDGFAAAGEDRCVIARGVNGVRGIDVSASGRNVYVLSATDDALSVLDRAPDGTLSQVAGRSACGSDRGQAGCRPIPGLNGVWTFALADDGASAYVSSGARETVSAIALDRAGHVTGPVSEKPACFGGDFDSPCREIPNLRGLVRSFAIPADGESLYMAGADAIVGFDREPFGRPAAAAREIRLTVEDRTLEPRQRIEWSVQVSSLDPECVIDQEVKARVLHGPNGFGSFNPQRTDALGQASGSGPPTYRNGRVIALLERDARCSAARSNQVKVTFSK